MKFKYYGAGLPLCAALLLTGCVDNGYDLSNIDATSEIKVVDLTLPVNLDDILLDDIITIDEDSKIDTVKIDGKTAYVVTESGEFHSDPITIDGFTATTPAIAPSELVFASPSFTTVRRANGPSAVYRLSSFEPRNIEMSARNVDESIVDITEIYTDEDPMSLVLDLTPNVNLGTAITMQLNDLRFHLFKGMRLAPLPQGYTYNETEGTLHINHLDCPGNAAQIRLEVLGIDRVKAGATFADHSLDYKTTVNLDEGSMTLTANNPSDFPTGLETFSFTVTTTLSDLTANAISGVLEYKLEGNGLDIDPIDLSDLPDFLAQDETDLRLANPQLYVSLTNPVYSQHLAFSSGFSLSSEHGADSKTYSLDNNGRIHIGFDRGVGPYNYVLSPAMANNVPQYSTGLTHVKFSSLSDVLSGKGLPDRIRVDLINPEMPRQEVTKFALNTTYDGVVGSYDFFAPLAFKTGANGAVIVYSDTEDGWGSDDLDKMVITKMRIEFDATSNLPLTADLTAHPIDRKGNKMSNVEITKVTLPANAKDDHIVIEITDGVIRDLDGISFEATVHAGSDEVLSPDMTIALKNLKATVSGSYTTDF